MLFKYSCPIMNYIFNWSFCRKLKLVLSRIPSLPNKHIYKAIKGVDSNRK